MNKYYLKVSSFVALFAMCVALLPANAADVALTAADAEIDTGDVTAGYAEASVSWTTDSDYAIGDTIRLTVTWSDTTGTPQHGSSTGLLAACGTDSATLSGTMGGFTTSEATFTLDTGIASSQPADICIAVPVEDGGVLYEANFSLALITSNVNGDYGAAEFYVNGGNDVLVDASVQPTLEFAVVSSSDVGIEQHECHMGTLTLTNVGTCDYRVSVSTNADNGFQVTIESDHSLSTATYATITDTGVDTPVAIGSATYGIAVTGATSGGYDGSGYTNAIIEDTAFDANDNPVPQSATNFVSYTDSFLGTDANSTTLVEHRASINSASVVGYYSQTVTYKVTPSF